MDQFRRNMYSKVRGLSRYHPKGHVYRGKAKNIFLITGQKSRADMLFSLSLPPFKF